MTTEGWMVYVGPHSRAGVQGVRNQHRLRGAVPVYGCERRTPQLKLAHSGRFRNEFEIKRNKAHGGCLGIERR